MHFLTVGSVESRETISSSTYYEGVGGEKVRRRGSGREMGWGEGRASFFSHCSRRADTVLPTSVRRVLLSLGRFKSAGWQTEESARAKTNADMEKIGRREIVIAEEKGDPPDICVVDSGGGGREREGHKRLGEGEGNENKLASASDFVRSRRQGPKS